MLVYVNGGGEMCDPFLSIGISHKTDLGWQHVSVTIRISGDRLRELADQMDAAVLANRNIFAEKIGGGV